MSGSRVPGLRPECERERWVAYFDLLGIGRRIQSETRLAVFLAYQQAIEELAKSQDDKPMVRSVWFSDTFLIISEDCSGRSFAQVESVARWFIYTMLLRRIPLRGAIAFGSMYADVECGVYIGQPMIEAYEYGERQNWIGLTLCASAECEMARLGVPVAERLHYAYWLAEWNRHGKPRSASERVGACLLGEWALVNGKNPCIAAMEQLASESEDESVREKYRRAIAFVDANRRKPIGEV